jgi:hypothetical protein
MKSSWLFAAVAIGGSAALGLALIQSPVPAVYSAALLATSGVVALTTSTGP